MHCSICPPYVEMKKMWNTSLVPIQWAKPNDATKMPQLLCVKLKDPFFYIPGPEAITCCHTPVPFVPKDQNPPCCPQLRPIEDIWGILKAKTYEGGWEAASEQQLKRKIRQSIRTLDAEVLKNMMRKVTQRVRHAARAGTRSHVHWVGTRRVTVWLGHQKISWPFDQYMIFYQCFNFVPNFSAHQLH